MLKSFSELQDENLVLHRENDMLRAQVVMLQSKLNIPAPSPTPLPRDSSGESSANTVGINSPSNPTITWSFVPNNPTGSAQVTFTNATPDSKKELPMYDVNNDLKKTADELDAFRVHRDVVLRTRQRLQDEAFQLRAIADLKIKLAARVAQEVQEDVEFDEDDDTE